MSEIAINKSIVMIIAIIVLISLIIYFYMLYSKYKSSSDRISSYTNESMNEVSLKSECMNKNIISVMDIAKNPVRNNPCKVFESVGCSDIFIESNTPYYKCIIYCYGENNLKYKCEVKYNCITNTAELMGICTQV